MSMLKACGSDEKLFVDDVFSAYTFVGSSSTQTINNGIDLAGKGGLVWVKGRSVASSNVLEDTTQSLGKFMRSDTTQALLDGSSAYITSFNSDGFTMGVGGIQNNNGDTNVAWTFRKAAKFFDVVTYTGTGTAGQTVSHNLGIAPGMVIIKRTDSAKDWMVWHRYNSNKGLMLNSTGAELDYTSTGGFIGASTSNITLNLAADAWTNLNGATYVAYLFAHDTSTDGIIQCGSFTTDGIGNATVSLGWEPQYVMYKMSSSADPWFVTDTMRGFDLTAVDRYLSPNSSGAESAGGTNVDPLATGFKMLASAPSQTYIYLAIRRSNKPPTTGTQVYNAIARTGTGAAATVTGVGFAPDLALSKNRAGSATTFADKLRGTSVYLYSGVTSSEVSSTSTQDLTAYNMDGISVGTTNNTSFNVSSANLIQYFFKRAVGVFDVVCYTGTGSNKTEAHSLKAAPELWLVKSRSGTTGWVFGSSLLANTEYIACPSPNGRVTDATMWNSAYPTSTTLSLGTSSTTNASAATFAAYLWATLAGVSKVFTYTGNGSSQNIDCGFTSGARFVMVIRCTASTSQDVFVWDSTRGIVSGNDPHLSLNTTAAEVTTDDSIDPLIAGFTINQVSATNVNVYGAVYIGLAFA